MRAGLVAAVAIVAVARVAGAAVEDDLRDGDKYFEQGDWKKAAAAYDRAIGKAPGEVSAEAYGKRAAIFIIQKDYQGGLEFIARAKTRYPHAPEVLEQEALLLWQTDHKDDAIRIAEQVVAQRPQTFSNQKIIGEYYAGRDPVKTAAAFEQYLAHRPPELESGDVLPRIRLGLAYLASARGDVDDNDDAHAAKLYGKAAGQFELVARRFGKKPNAQVNADNGLCAAYAGLGRWDQATTVCERVVANPTHVDPSGAAWFNLAEAYLARKQTAKARGAANEFLRARKGEARGQILLGDTYFEDRDWPSALDHYLAAEKLLRPNQTHDQVRLSIQLGKTYRRLPAPAVGPNPNLDKAIDALSAAHAANPRSLELATELGDAYLEAKQDNKAAALADRVLDGADAAKAPADQRADLLTLAGKALYNQRKLKEARQRFEAAAQIKPGDIVIRRALVATIDEQAFEAIDDPRRAQQLLEQALVIDGNSPVTLTNLAILAIDRGECDVGQKLTARLREVRGADVVLVAQLSARGYLCGGHPDVKKAAAAYAAAEQEAKKANAQLALAEIYTEWAPLEWDTDLATAVSQLELAVQIGGQEPELGPAARRNLSLALYRRGWKQMRDGHPTDAASDFERAIRDPSVLRGTEPLAFEFSYAIALLDTGRAQDSGKILRGLAAKGSPGTYLKGAYAKAGLAFFSAYATYRAGTGATRQAACGELAKVEGDLGARVRELTASCWEMVAYDEWRAGHIAGAAKALATAEKSATADQKRRITLDRAALALGKDKLGELESLGGNPPEALVDLGIVYDLLGRPKDAYDAWQRAKARGVTLRELQKWIDAKRRIYGY